MDHKAQTIKNQMTLALLVNILEERGIMTEREVHERLTNQVQLSKTLEPAMKDELIKLIKED